MAFLNAALEFKPLLGEHGLLPVPEFTKAVGFSSSPSLFFFAPNDAAFTVAAWLGVLLALTGLADRYQTWLSMLVWALAWVLYISFVNTGQIFYAFGWESILLEACFYAIFLGSRRVAPQTIGIWLLRWLLFRLMFGAGLIKMRGDRCWRDLTCLDYPYETQPMPGPLSWFFHWAPGWFHTSGVLFNHFAELVVPFGYLSVQPVRNMLSREQVMNTVYNRFHLVGTYGAFGSITRPRYEVIVEGTDEAVVSASTKWRAYEFRGKPGSLERMPPQIGPYHLRLDWLMWFAAMSSYQEQPWFTPFMAKLLEGDRAVLSLLRSNPFPLRPPRYVRALLYEYHFTNPAERAAEEDHSRP